MLKRAKTIKRSSTSVATDAYMQKLNKELVGPLNSKVNFQIVKDKENAMRDLTIMTK